MSEPVFACVLEVAERITIVVVEMQDGKLDDAEKKCVIEEAGVNKLDRYHYIHLDHNADNQGPWTLLWFLGAHTLPAIEHC